MELCRVCRDNDVTRPAEFIVWGKLFPRDSLGPRCMEHLDEMIHVDQLDQYAIYRIPVVHSNEVTERWRQHSILLNTIAWKVAQALGEIPEGASTHGGEVQADIDRLIERLAAATPESPPVR